MRKYKGQDVLAAVMVFMLAGSLAGCCKESDDGAGNSLSLLGGVLGTGIIEPPVPLGNAGAFRVLGATTVTNTGPTAIAGGPSDGDLGVSPGNACTGFPAPCTGGGPGTVSGSIFIDAGAGTAANGQADLTIAYNNATPASRPGGTTVAGNIGGLTLAPGIYTSTSSLAISSGDLTLTGLGDSNAVFIFQIASALTVTSGRQVILTGGAQASNVFWQVGSSATLGTNSFVSGTIMAQASITLATGATLQGRALARTGAVSLDTSTVSP